MKHKQAFTPPHKILASFALSILLATGCGSVSAQPSSSGNSSSPLSEAVENSQSSLAESSSVDPGDQTGGSEAVPITSGSFYNSVQGISSQLELSASGDHLYVTKEISGSADQKSIRLFFWEAVQILKLPEMGANYTGASFTFLSADGALEYFSVYDFNSSLDFTSNTFGSFSGNDLFTAFYAAVFGGHDKTNVSDVFYYNLAQEQGLQGYSVPETYRNGHFWVFSCFGSNCGYSVNDTEISVTIPTASTYSAGKQAGSELNGAADLFNQLFAQDNIAMPYTKLSVKYIDLYSAETLWDWCSEKSSGSWSVTKNKCYNADFAQGVKEN